MSLGILINIADTVYYHITLRRTTFVIFEQFSSEQNIGILMFRFLLDYWYMLLLTIVFIYLVFLFDKKIKVSEPKINNNWVYLITTTTLLLVYAVLIIGGIRGGFNDTTRPMTLSTASKFIEKPNQRSLVLNTAFSLLRSARKSSLQEVKYFTSVAEQQKIYSAFHSGKNKPDSLFQKKNVVLFILESFGREHIGALNKHIPNYNGFTPFLDSLIEDSYTFKHAFANGRKSISGMPSNIASIPSLKAPFILSYYSGNKINSLANILKEENYYSAFFHGAHNGSMGFDAFAKQAGFDDYFGLTEYGNDNHFDGYWGIWDEEFFQFFADEIAKMKTPFFTSLFSVSSHHPFNLPERFKDKFPKGNLPIQRTIGYSDYALKKFFETASKMPWFKNTIFVITADHAATFSDLPEYKTPSGFFAVPIIIYDPSDKNLKGYNKTTAVQQLDIMPTILDRIGYSKDYIAFGTNMFDSASQHFAIADMADIYHFFQNDTLIQYDGKSIVGMYNYEKDPLFKENLAAKQEKITTDILTLTQAFIQEYNRRLIKNDMAVSSD